MDPALSKISFPARTSSVRWFFLKHHCFDLLSIEGQTLDEGTGDDSQIGLVSDRVEKCRGSTVPASIENGPLVIGNPFLRFSIIIGVTPHTQVLGALDKQFA